MAAISGARATRTVRRGVFEIAILVVALTGCSSDDGGPQSAAGSGGSSAPASSASSAAGSGASGRATTAGSGATMAAAPSAAGAPSAARPATPPPTAATPSSPGGSNPPAGATPAGTTPPGATPPGAAQPPTAATPAGVVFPGAEWLTMAPADAGFDGAKLEQAGTDLLTSLPGRQCFAVFRNGYLVYEKYYTGDARTRNTGYSTSKSFGSTLVGMAVTQGLFKTDDLVKTLLPESTVGANVQIKHLLTMTGHTDPPGTMFDYGMGQMLLGNLADSIAAKSGLPTAQFYETNLRAPLEFQDTDWGGGRFLSFAGNVSTTCRDAARLGHLWANRGRWKDQQLISDQYFNEATTAAFPMANSGYGYNFWLNIAFSRTRQVGLSFAAIGANEQYIVIIPDLQLVVTSYGNDPDNQMGSGPTVIGGVLEALL